MRLNSEKQEVQGNIEGKVFTIEATAKSFEVMTSNLYSNKIRAVCRELCTNALDSHIEAGCPETPFTVKVPNRLEPTFYVEDFGTGMDEETMFNLYTTLFGSNKTGSNKTAGAFGLGSKSPFAYTEMFTVTTRYNGWEGVFQCYLNEDRIPSISKVIERETTEHNGVKVEFPVKESDCYSFVQELQTVLRPFKVNPSIIGSNLDIKEYDITFKGNDWIVNNNGNRYRKIVVMGCVEYEFDMYDLTRDQDVINILKKEFIQESDRHAFWELYRKNCFIIFFKMGKLNIAPSREKLSLDKRTKVNLINKYISVYKEIRDDFLKTHFSDDMCIWDLFNKVHDVQSSLQGMEKAVLSHRIKGVTIQNLLVLPNEYVNDNSIIDTWYADSYYAYKFNTTRYRTKKRNYSKVLSLAGLLHNNKYSVVYHNESDNDRSAMYRLKQNIADQQLNVLLISNKKLIDYLGITDYKKISDFDYIKKPGGSSSTSSSDKRPAYHIMDESMYSIKQSLTRTELEDKPDLINLPKKLYLLRDYTNWKGNNNIADHHYWNRLLKKVSSITGMDFSTTPIFGVTKLESNTKRFKDDSSWVFVDTYLSDVINDFLNNNKKKELLDNLRKYNIAYGFGKLSKYDYPSVFTSLNIVAHDNRILNISKPVKNLYDVYNKMSIISQTINSNEIEDFKNYVANLKNILNKLKLSKSTITFINYIEKLFFEKSLTDLTVSVENFKNRYPVINIIDNQASNRNIEVIFDYIKLVEKAS